MTWIDYKQIKASVNILQVLGYYGIELQRVGERHLKGACPLPGHAGDRSNTNAFHVDTEKNAFNCFTHCGGGYTYGNDMTFVWYDASENQEITFSSGATIQGGEVDPRFPAHSGFGVGFCAIRSLADGIKSACRVD